VRCSWMRVAVPFLLALSLACPKKPVEPVLAPAPTPAPQGQPKTPAEQAVALYDRGEYSPARGILEELERQGSLNGPLMYRLGFCYGYAGDEAKQREWMARALEALQQEATTANSLEVSFFLANALTNTGQTVAAARTAAEATSLIETKQWPEPARALDRFRVAKLYADQGRGDEATRWYRAALQAFAAEGEPAPGYVRWARRYLAQRAIARGDSADAAEQLAALVALGGAPAADYDRLAGARVRLGQWSQAAEAWAEAVRLDPANADRPRYCRNLALQAETIRSLPAASPAGGSWASLSKEDLETLLREQAAIARQIHKDAATTPPADAAARANLERTLATAQSTFVAAALEYALRNYDIRETAFVGGYAPLIFHPEEWQLPPASPPQGDQN